MNLFPLFEQISSFILVTLIIQTRACPEKCHCSKTKGVVECQGKEITFFPKNIPPWTKFLSMEETLITFMSEDNFADLKELQVFKCQKHQSLTLGDNVFRNNKKLTKIDLSNNRIAKIGTGCFKGLSLDTLDLSSNQLETFKETYLSGVSEIKNLFLQSNKISIVEDDSFTTISNLSHLYLNHNLLKKAPGTNSMKFHSKVEVLDMSGNPINVIGPNFFGGFPSLRYLYLENVVKMANLVIHEESLETNTDIQKLDLSNNFMLGIPFEIFKMNRAIEILNLAGNSLTTFPNLGYLKDLQYLDFSDNNLKILKSSDFKHNSKLKEARFRGNKIETLDFAVFSSLQSLSLLDLSSNQISTVPENVLQSVASSLSQFHFSYAGAHWNWLDDNPLNCDCAILPLLIYISSVHMAADGVTCLYPSDLKGEKLAGMSEDDLTCVIPVITEFYPGHSSLNVLIGQTLELRCAAESDSNEVIQVEWVTPRDGSYTIPDIRDDNPVVQIGRVTVKNDGTLLVYNSQQSDSGLYKCLAQNEHGKSEKTVQVNVTDYVSEQHLLQQCDLCDNDCNKYKISQVKVVEIGYESLTIDWMPTELRIAEYYIWYREFAGETPNRGVGSDSSKSIKVIKANNYTIQDLSPSTAYVVCVQMAGQPCFEMISFSHCVDVNTMGTSKLGSSIILIFIGFCAGSLFGLCGCIAMLFNNKSSGSKKNMRNHHRFPETPQMGGTVPFLPQSSNQQETEILSGDPDILYPDIYAGSIRGKRF